MRVKVNFRDVTDYVPAEMHFPDLVRGFEDLGFVRLGRMARVSVPGLHVQAKHYPEPHRRTFIEMKTIPLTVLAAPDGSAFVLVDWWWGMPEVRVRTALTTGAVVETRRTWDAPPVWPSIEAKVSKTYVLHEEQCQWAARGRDIRVAGGGPAELWHAHQVHVAAYLATHHGMPDAHREMPQAVKLSDRVAIHDIRTVRQGRLHAIALAITLAGLCVTCMWIAVAFGLVQMLVFFAVVVLPIYIGTPRLLLWLKYKRRLRPRFA